MFRFVYFIFHLLIALVFIGCQSNLVAPPKIYGTYLFNSNAFQNAGDVMIKKISNELIADGKTIDGFTFLGYDLAIIMINMVFNNLELEINSNNTINWTERINKAFSDGLMITNESKKNLDLFIESNYVFYEDGSNMSPLFEILENGHKLRVAVYDSDINDSNFAARAWGANFAFYKVTNK